MLFSIIVPVYNAKDHLQQCLESIAAQTFTDFEAILVDDGSTDGCAQMLDEFAGICDRCKVIHKKNGGVTSARKAGVSIAQGEYITHLDADDYLAPTYLERFAELISEAEKPVDIFFCGHTRVEGDQRATRRASSLHGGEGVFEREEIENSFLRNLDRWRHTLWGACIRRELSRLFNLRIDDDVMYGEDKCVLWPCMSEARRIQLILDPMYYYRIHDQSMMHRKGKKINWAGVIKRYELLDSMMPVDKFNLQEQLALTAVAVCFRTAVSSYEYMSYREATKCIRAGLSNATISKYFKKRPANAKLDTKVVFFILKYRLLMLIKLYNVLIEPNMHVLKKLFPKLK